MKKSLVNWFVNIFSKNKKSKILCHKGRTKTPNRMDATGCSAYSFASDMSLIGF